MTKARTNRRILTFRLDPEDAAYLRRCAKQLKTDRTGALRQLLKDHRAQNNQ